MPKKFKAELNGDESRADASASFTLPFDTRDVWGKAKVPVKVTINGYTWRSTVGNRGGIQYIVVNAEARRSAGVKAGDSVTIMLEPDTEKRIAIVPAELKRALAEDRELRRWYDGLNYSTRKWIGDWISQVKSAEARVRRAEQIAERLLATMEAERELPPLLRLAFTRDPRALEGWKLMSASHRRAHLLGIFYYRSPDARDRRIARTIEDAIAFAERKSNR